jgi:hypothetical protein
MSSSAPSIIDLGLDVHKDSITIAVLPSGAKSPPRLERLPSDARGVPTGRSRLGMSPRRDR